MIDSNDEGAKKELLEGLELSSEYASAYSSPLDILLHNQEHVRSLTERRGLYNGTVEIINALNYLSGFRCRYSEPNQFVLQETGDGSAFWTKSPRSLDAFAGTRFELSFSPYEDGGGMAHIVSGNDYVFSAAYRRREDGSVGFEDLVFYYPGAWEKRWHELLAFVRAKKASIERANKEPIKPAK